MKIEIGIHSDCYTYLTLVMLTKLGTDMFSLRNKPASVAQLDAHLTCDMEVEGLTPAGSGNLLLWRLIVKYFLRSFSPFC